MPSAATDAVDPALLRGWLAARSLARGLPPPVADAGGLRVDSGLAEEARRYVFAGPAPAIRTLAASIRAPRTFIKMCGPGDLLLALAPAGWALRPGAWLMTHPGTPDGAVALPPGYRIDVDRQGPLSAARVRAEDGTVAASGYAAEHDGVFVYDRIQTDAAHRRRGLGRALMAALGSTQRSGRARRVLVASADGRALYATLGWTALSAYSTIVIPDC